MSWPQVATGLVSLTALLGPMSLTQRPLPPCKAMLRNGPTTCDADAAPSDGAVPQLSSAAASERARPYSRRPTTSTGGKLTLAF